jgi:hypothetical protein
LIKKQDTAGCWWLMPVIWGWDWENCSLRPSQANSSQDSIFKTSRTKWTGGMAQVVQATFARSKSWFQAPVPPKKKKKSKTQQFVEEIAPHLTKTNRFKVKDGKRYSKQWSLKASKSTYIHIWQNGL